MIRNWVIVKQKSVQGIVEYSVSNDVVGKRTFSHDFKTLSEATKCLKSMKFLDARKESSERLRESMQ
jgi:hypothetical protein